MSKMTAVTMVSNLGVVTRASESDRCPMEGSNPLDFG